MLSTPEVYFSVQRLKLHLCMKRRLEGRKEEGKEEGRDRETDEGREENQLVGWSNLVKPLWKTLGLGAPGWLS